MKPPGPARQVPEPSLRLVVLFRAPTHLANGKAAPSLNIPPTGVAPALALAALASGSAVRQPPSSPQYMPRPSSLAPATRTCSWKTAWSSSTSVVSFDTQSTGRPKSLTETLEAGYADHVSDLQQGTTRIHRGIDEAVMASLRASLSQLGKIARAGLLDEDMPKALQGPVERQFDVIWRRFRGYIEEELYEKTSLGRVGHRNSPTTLWSSSPRSCWQPGSRCCPAPFSWLRAQLLYSLCPADATFWQVFKTPFFWVVLVLTVLPMYGVSVCKPNHFARPQLPRGSRPSPVAGQTPTCCYSRSSSAPTSTSSFPSYAASRRFSAWCWACCPRSSSQSSTLLASTASCRTPGKTRSRARTCRASSSPRCVPRPRRV